MGLIAVLLVVLFIILALWGSFSEATSGKNTNSENIATTVVTLIVLVGGFLLYVLFSQGGF